MGSREANWEFLAIIQFFAIILSQGSSSRGGKRQLDSGYILQVESAGSADVFDVWRDEWRRGRNDSKIFGRAPETVEFPSQLIKERLPEGRAWWEIPEVSLQTCSV